MEEKWYLENTGNLNQMLRVRDDIDLPQTMDEFPHLVLIKHEFHAADDIMFPDPACIAFFTVFENNHLEALEEENSSALLAVDICEGMMQFYLYAKDPEKTIYDCIDFLKSNPLYKCDFEVIKNDNGDRLNDLI
ncbi:DUF695 domain-containing protein [Halarcobacter sp.]|uniref:DUF695 domain-containing protein n=1 Tax=Halarcobacter sp. TaxID=2321133 RepID=UPI0029F5599A|nr:DUF695 domain-containing protein [Halarcobacter sp.]